jgi:hypothetical protein
MVKFEKCVCEENWLRFKTEIFLLLLAITLYILSAFCYFYEASSQGMLPFINNPYREYAIPLTLVASAFLVVAAILYSKRR